MPALQLRRRPLSAVLHRLQTNRARNRHRKRHPGVANPIVLHQICLPKTHPRIQNPRKKLKKKQQIRTTPIPNPPETTFQYQLQAKKSRNPRYFTTRRTISEANWREKGPRNGKFGLRSLSPLSFSPPSPTSQNSAFVAGPGGILQIGVGVDHERDDDVRSDGGDWLFWF